ncbi:MAG TPA: hypothetical protein VML00_07860 [Bacteroidota bacterium]|nr:hypothetical protein [Bacteroidota bacterium]
MFEKSRRSDIPRCIPAVLPVFLLLCAFGGAARGQEGPSLPSHAGTIHLSPALRDSLIRLPDQFIAAGTDTVVFDSATVLRRGIDYSLGYRFGTLRLDSAFLARALAAPAGPGGLLTVSYRFFPFHFQQEYTRRSVVVLRDSTGRDTLHVARPRGGFSIDDIFGANFQKSGSIVRGFTVGSNRDLSLNSGFRMQFSGKLASDIEVAATLTDDNTPIQPEGTTQTIQEFDKVFVEIKSTNLAATLGDFVLDLKGQEFASLSRKLQGAMGTADYRFGSIGESAVIAGAVTRGKFNTMQFSGLDAVQGPYVLTGKNGERAIIVIAGTEKVYVNGETQVRGETNDYTIDYSTGEITFMPRRLITAASRITVDYQYTDRQYSRSLFAGQSATSVFDGRGKFTFTFVHEADNPDAPIDFTVTDSARQVLEQAGGDRNKAVQSGVSRVDTGGIYFRVDTLIAGRGAVSYYRYAPGDTAAHYLVTFSFVGTGQGEYVRQQVGVFIWKGAGGGDYEPIRYLPLPQSQQVMDFALELQPVKSLKVSGEYAGSSFNANQFSDLPGVTSTGVATKFALAFSPRDMTVGDVNVGGLDLTLNDRRVGATFNPVDRTNDIEFNRRWGVDSLTGGDEEIREADLRYLPAGGVTVGGSYGRITRGSDLTSVRTAGDVAIQKADLPLVNYSVEHTRSTQTSLDEEDNWVKQRGSVAYAFWNLTPSFSYEGERKEITALDSSTYRDGSLKFDQFGPKLGVKALGPVSLSLEYLWRSDDQATGGALQRQAASFTQVYAGRLAETAHITSTLDVTLSSKKFSDVFKQLGNADIQTVLVRSQSRYSPLNRGVDADVYYEVATERTSKLEQIFVHVAPGTGNYTYLGDLNHNGIADPDEFVPARFDGDYITITVPTDAMYPIIDLKTSMRVRFTPSRFLGRGEGFWGGALSAISTETYARIDEKSSEHDLKQIYLLNLKHFLQDSTTLTGTQLLTQDVYLFEGKTLYSARLRFSQTRGLTNFAGGLEHAYGRERSLRLRWQLVPEISNQLDYVNKIDRVFSDEISTRIHDILSNEVSFDVSYRPETRLELGMKFDLAKSVDSFQVPALGAALNAQSVRLVYAFQGAGQARVEGSREEERLGGTPASFPYELTGGRVAGKTWTWRLGFDYRVTQFVQASATYDGRTEGGAPPVHTARAEVRAFF